MPQMYLPIFPEGSTNITATLAFIKKDNQITYFNGHMPVFTHSEDDINSFKMITCQFVVSGAIRQRDIVKTFGVKSNFVKRAVKQYRAEGPSSFYKPRRRGGPSVFTAPVLEKAQSLLDSGNTPEEVAIELGIKYDTFYRAMKAGKLHYIQKKVTQKE